MFHFNPTKIGTQLDYPRISGEPQKNFLYKGEPWNRRRPRQSKFIFRWAYQLSHLQRPKAHLPWPPLCAGCFWRIERRCSHDLFSDWYSHTTYIKALHFGMYRILSKKHKHLQGVWIENKKSCLNGVLDFQCIRQTARLREAPYFLLLKLRVSREKKPKQVVDLVSDVRLRWQWRRLFWINLIVTNYLNSVQIHNINP